MPALQSICGTVKLHPIAPSSSAIREWYSQPFLAIGNSSAPSYPVTAVRQEMAETIQNEFPMYGSTAQEAASFHKRISIR